jgi:BRCT domain type II-containing protein
MSRRHIDSESEGEEPEIVETLNVSPKHVLKKVLKNWLFLAHARPTQPFGTLDQASSISPKKTPTLVEKAPPAVAGYLDGKNFVFSGVLPSMGREAAEDLIKSHGGKVPCVDRSVPVCVLSLLLLFFFNKKCPRERWPLR